MLKQIVFCLAVLIFPITTYGQAQLDKSRVNRAFQKANSFQFNNSDSSIFYFNQVIDHFVDQDTLIHINLRLAQSYALKVEVDSAKVYLKKNLKYELSDIENHWSKANLALSHRFSATIMNREGKYDSAIAILKRNLPTLKNDTTLKRELIAGLNDIGAHYNEKGDLESATLYLNESIKISSNVKTNWAKRLELSSYYNLAQMHSSHDDLINAVKYYDHVILKAKNNHAHLYLLGICSKAKWLAKMLKFDSAITVLNQGFDALKNKTVLQDRSVKGFLPDIKGRYYSVYGQIMDLMNNDEKGIKYIQYSIDEYSKMSSDGSPTIANAYNNLGYLYYKSGRYKKAEGHLLQSIDTHKINMASENATMPIAYTNLASVYHDLEHYKKSINYFDSALYFSKRHLSNGLAFYVDPKVFWDSTDGIISGLIHEPSILYSLDKLYNEITHQLIANSMIHNSPKVMERKHKTIEGLLRILSRQAEDSTSQKIWYVLELLKARQLSFQKNDQQAMFAEIPSISLTQEKLLKKQLAYLIAQDREKDFGLIHQLQRQYDSLVLSFEKSHERYYNLKYNPKIVSSEEVQKELLEDQQVLLEYYIGDSSIYTIVVNRQSMVVKQLNKPVNLDSYIFALNEALKNDNIHIYQENAHYLYQSLFAPVEEHLGGKNIIIIPSGSLWHVNFDLLLKQLSNEKEYAKLPYLINEYTFSYGYSATLLFQEKERNREHLDNNKLMAFSYGNRGQESLQANLFRSEELPESLPGSVEEINMISEHFEGAYFIGSNASESQFKQNASNYSLLHLALHGSINEKEPNKSLLQFYPETDPSEDGHLYVHELYNLDLNAELAVLSACNTGSGQMIRGEGIMSLGRAFIYAGCKSLVYTLWELSDSKAPKIMNFFYKNLDNGTSKAEALRQAKLEYLKNADNLGASPFFWGSLVLVGDQSALQHTSSLLNIWILVAIVICTVGLIGFVKASKPTATIA